jgi:hypothetical protein
MPTQRAEDRRQRQSDPPAGRIERRCGADRRTFHVTVESIAEVEARLVLLTSKGKPDDDDHHSGWDKLIIPLSRQP